MNPSSGDSTLIFAATKRHLPTVKALLPSVSPFLLNVRNSVEQTALLVAVQNNDTDIAMALIDASADVNTADKRGLTPLLCCPHDVTLARVLIANGADVGAYTFGCITTLMFACMYSNTKMVSLLIDAHQAAHSSTRDADTGAGTDTTTDAITSTSGNGAGNPATTAWVNAIDKQGCTALSEAVSRGSFACVKLLIDAKASPHPIPRHCHREHPHVKHWPRLSLLHLTKDMDITRLLLEAGARDGMDGEGYTALARACERRDATEMVKLLLEYGSDANPQDGPSSPLHCAVSHGNLANIYALLEADPPADVNARDILGQTPLMVAVIDRQASIVKILLEHGADPMISDFQGCIPLMHACDAESLRLLIESNRRSVHHICDHHDRSVLTYWASNDMCSMIPYLFKCCDEYSIDIDVNRPYEHGDTALHMAIYHHNAEAVRLLLENGASVLGSGLFRTSALMKPLMTDEYDATINYLYGPASSATADDRNADALGNECLKLLLSHISSHIDIIVENEITAINRWRCECDIQRFEEDSE